MKNLSKNKKGSVFVWFVVMAAVFAIGLIYMTFTQVVIKVQEATWDAVDDSEYVQTYNTVVLVWKYWPIIAIIGLIIAGIILASRKEPYSGFE